MEILIRRYKEGDLPFVRGSFEQLHDYVVSIDPIKRLRKMPEYMDVFFAKFLKNIQNNQGAIFIAEGTGKLVGFVAGFVADKQNEENLLEVVPSQLGIISDLFVLPEYRGKQIGTKLMNEIEKYLVEKNCDALWVDTTGFNTPARHLYQSVGFMEREIGLIKKIE